METEVKKRQVNNVKITWGYTIAATKSAEVLEVCTAYLSIMGGGYPNYLISTKGKSAKDIKSIIDQNINAPIKVNKAIEIKVAVMVFQQVPKGVSPVVIVAARPQSNN